MLFFCTKTKKETEIFRSTSAPKFFRPVTRVTWLTQPCTTQEHTVKEIGGSGNGCSFEGGHYESAAYSSM